MSIVAKIIESISASPLRKIAGMSVLLLAVMIAAYRAGAGSARDISSTPRASDASGMTDPVSVAAFSERDRLRDQLLRLPTDEEEAFWLSAVVPEPKTPRLPSAAVVIAMPSPPGAAVETGRRVAELEIASATPETVSRLNEEIILWYDQDPVRATEWLNTTDRFDEMSPALASIAASLGERGHLDMSLEVLKAISDPEAHRRAVLDIYSLEARLGRVTEETLSAAGWSADDIRLVRQGD
jgi:hypothetical protein